MKWNKTAVLAVVAIIFVSYVYSSIREMQLSREVAEEKRKGCSEQSNYDCELISKFHDECFEASYRAEYRIRKFHSGEYNNCVDQKIAQHLSTVSD